LVKTDRPTLHRYTTYNSLPRRVAMTRTVRARTHTHTHTHTHCHAGQRQQLGLAQRVGCQKQTALSGPLPRKHSPKRGETRLMIALLLIYRPRKDERLS